MCYNSLVCMKSNFETNIKLYQKKYLQSFLYTSFISYNIGHKYINWVIVKDEFLLLLIILLFISIENLRKSLSGMKKDPILLNYLNI